MTTRRLDDGSAVHVGCRRCDELILLDPRRMQQRKVGVFLVCPVCECRFLVRHADLRRPAPDEADGAGEGGAGVSDRPVGVASVVSRALVDRPPAVAGGSQPPARDGWLRRRWAQLVSRRSASSRRGSGR